MSNKVIIAVIAVMGLLALIVMNSVPQTVPMVDKSSENDSAIDNSAQDLAAPNGNFDGRTPSDSMDGSMQAPPPVVGEATTPAQEVEKAKSSVDKAVQDLENATKVPGVGMKNAVRNAVDEVRGAARDLGLAAEEAASQTADQLRDSLRSGDVSATGDATMNGDAAGTRATAKGDGTGGTTGASSAPAATGMTTDTAADTGLGTGLGTGSNSGSGSGVDNAAVRDGRADGAASATGSTLNVDSNAKVAPDRFSVLTVEGFDLDRALVLLENSDLSDVDKTALRVSLEAAVDDPETLRDVLPRLRMALRP
ncbi:hypothetical protein [Brevirhabdus sp.]|uniref:hypothetical protein n=1 Tax=Brevirhabdus sp. TaxID=2004514 RepID=UPI004059D74A